MNKLKCLPQKVFPDLTNVCEEGHSLHFSTQWVSSLLTLKYQTTLKKLARSKRSSLFCPMFSGEDFFYNINNLCQRYYIVNDIIF